MRTMQRLIWAGLCLSLFFLPRAALAWRGGGYGGSVPWSCGWTGNGAWAWPGMILGIAFWVLVALAIVYLIRRIVQDTRRTRPPLSVGSGPTEILKARYARGEISTEDFQRMKRDLQ